MQKRRTANTMEMEMDNTDVTANINNNADNYESNIKLDEQEEHDDNISIKEELAEETYITINDINTIQ